AGSEVGVSSPSALGWDGLRRRLLLGAAPFAVVCAACAPPPPWAAEAGSAASAFPCACSTACPSCCFFFRRRFRRRDRPDVSFGGGRFSPSAPATSPIDPSLSRAASISCVARAV